MIKKTVISFSLFSMGACALIADDAQKPAAPTPSGTEIKSDAPTSPLRIGYVDPYRIIEILDEWGDQQRKITQELNDQIKEYQSLEANFKAKSAELQNIGSAISQEARKEKEKELSSLQKKIVVEQQMLKEGSDQMAQQAQFDIMKKIEKTVSEIKDDEQLDMVLGMGVISASERVDITQKVAQRMNTEYRAQNKKNSPSMSQASVLKTAQTDAKGRPTQQQATL